MSETITPNNNTLAPTILVIVGITGDLSKRKLLPAIEKLVAANAVPQQLKVVGITRRNVSTKQILQSLPDSFAHGFLTQNLQIFKMDLAKKRDYQSLERYLEELAADMGENVQKLFYLSVPPQISQPIVRLLGETDMAKEPTTKLLLEKPFGIDLASAQELIDQTKQHFIENQVYRIDHYLAKDMAQNLIVFREGNALFSHTWNKDFIERIDIVASEKIGIEGRASFYEQTGALRDLVQSHLLQLAALTLMHPSVTHDLRNICDCRVEALRQLHIPTDKPLDQYVKRGQYSTYRAEVQNESSMVETFTDITLASSDPSWEGVPIRIVTGKALNEKATEIRISYKKTKGFEQNQLVIRFQPSEGIEFTIWTKVPDYEWRVEKHPLGLDFKEKFAASTEAYEQVLLDAIRSDHSLFTTSDEVLEAWRILQPVQQAWSMNTSELLSYKPGSTISDVTS